MNTELRWKGAEWREIDGLHENKKYRLHI